MTSLDELPITEIQRIRLEPDDRIIVRAKNPQTLMRATVAKFLDVPETRVIIIGPDVHVIAINPSELSKATFGNKQNTTEAIAETTSSEEDCTEQAVWDISPWLGTVLKELRIGRELTQKQLAVELTRQLEDRKIDQSYVSRVENGEIISIRRLGLFCHALSKPINEVLKIAEKLQYSVVANED